ncbi:MAG: peptidoglycan DD-metalloendopeptidase family protein [Candidatus Marinimicrobia bacterium]|jgi:murein hydrolase activator|nr:peptidoglycan DD-metalloendopeptidase family protein [Candidatus Neomarinimicrobiota bacterium]MBT3617944.1 peptidoglycan DD-metalloendopeptidase family protein [Candidatus Neomarinimicrobiota bacterium]MBT3828683.1 peptidoglycan DD-metalloendopeptidase family protein [Candidatus Neomarinimicrobiota bacterium]MBT4794912.1 peptidoglycan DD-metalloendopeptidase family protein [Candidatus Neomarinimicrobiota bacterium]MBT5339498.1 peptidoglycan DD-metalloendopeptidase family protein [Candidatus
MVMILRWTTISILCLPAYLCAQADTRDYERELEHQSRAIQELKLEIQAAKRRIRNEAEKEKSTSRRISNLYEEISLSSRLLKQLKREQKTLKIEISDLEVNISRNENELEALKRRYSNRVKHIYTKGSLSDLERILSSTSWRQAVYRAKYLKIISRIDRQTQAKIHSLVYQIRQQKVNLEDKYQQSIALKKDREKRYEDLIAKKRQKEKELAQIQRNKSELAEYLKEKQEGVKQLNDIIIRIQDEKARFERAERIRRQQAALKTKKFSSLKGQLPWPATGRITAKFGNQWNAKLKTTTDNPGIDIKGKPGSPIRTVLGGIVTVITYLRGYGTTIIIDHGGGFYTVYSHVTQVETHVDSEVLAGDVIAFMGDSGSVNGSKLHFEIWGKSQKLNPEKWLAKR